MSSSCPSSTEHTCCFSTCHKRPSQHHIVMGGTGPLQSGFSEQAATFAQRLKSWLCMRQELCRAPSLYEVHRNSCRGPFYPWCRNKICLCHTQWPSTGSRLNHSDTNQKIENLDDDNPVEYSCLLLVRSSFWIVTCFETAMENLSAHQMLLICWKARCQTTCSQTRYPSIQEERSIYLGSCHHC